MDRRRFLQILGALPLSGKTLPVFSRNLFTQKLHNDRVLILGAGISGLITAQLLQRRYGFSQPGQVRVLEAESHVGGRIESCRSFQGGVAIDLGATWIHGIQGNPLSQMADQFDLARYQTDWSSLDLFGLNGRPISRSIRHLAEAKVYASYAAAKRRRNRLLQDESLADTLDAVGARSLFRPQEVEASEFFYSQMVDELCQYLQQESAMYWFTDEEFKGGDALFVHGFDNLTEHLSRGLHIDLNHKVQRVLLNSRGVRVFTDQGRFDAERAVVTLPLGVLKSGLVDFQPSLPANLQHSIRALGFGNRYRLVMEFPFVFWDPQAEIVGKVGTPYGRYGLGEHLSFVNRYPVVGRPILSMDAIERLSHQLEQMGATRATQYALDALRKIYGPNVPNPIQVEASHWGQDELYGGAYSAWVVGSGPDDNRNFQQVIGERLFFAGEHTCAEYPSTVHGALFSGERVASQVHVFAR